MSFRPIIYKRYVDDCFLAFRKEHHAEKFLLYLNAQHQNIKFTIEKESGNKINFLDTTITKKNSNNMISLILGIFRKPTFTNLGMNFHSNTYFNFKINNIKTLLHRAYELSSNWHLFDGEIAFLYKYFKGNGYPVNLFNKITNKFISEKFQPKDLKHTVKKMPFYHKIPFINNFTCKYIKKGFLEFLGNAYPQVEFNFIFMNSSRVQALLKHKDRLPVMLESGIVYSFKCGDCQATYIGSTVRALKTRASEHFSVSSRTGAWLTRPPASTIRDHLNSCKYSRSLDQFTILDRQNNIDALRISESIEIDIRKPNLNCDQSAFPLFLR
ncbi:MAG: hypothetical protein AAFP20_25215 [Cyanobacteria bacterium J06614_10]